MCITYDLFLLFDCSWRSLKRSNLSPRAISQQILGEQRWASPWLQPSKTSGSRVPWWTGFTYSSQESGNWAPIWTRAMQVLLLRRQWAKWTRTDRRRIRRRWIHWARAEVWEHRGESSKVTNPNQRWMYSHWFCFYNTNTSCLVCIVMCMNELR